MDNSSRLSGSSPRQLPYNIPLLVSLHILIETTPLLRGFAHFRDSMLSTKYTYV